jgi:hypothetical protein
LSSEDFVTALYTLDENDLLFQSGKNQFIELFCDFGFGHGWLTSIAICNLPEL